mmetsp:Transcript_23489/g.36747  ORF Transcript_23489/g.36747 Transcript_23489/m.36747 type:complete len:150 (-) Transcript_23489:282-731(-)
MVLSSECFRRKALKPLDCQLLGPSVPQPLGPQVYHASGLFYLFNLEADHASDLSWAIDATRARNVAGFINHRCGDTNLRFEKFAASCTNRRADGVPSRIALIATRDIKAGEVLCYDYFTFNKAEEELGIPMSKLVKCNCQHENCRGWVF